MQEFKNRVFERHNKRRRSRTEVWGSWIKKILLLVLVLTLFKYLGLGKGLRTFFWGESPKTTTEVREP